MYGVGFTEVKVLTRGLDLGHDGTRNCFEESKVCVAVERYGVEVSERRVSKEVNRKS